jgi:hypothetical protein
MNKLMESTLFPVKEKVAYLDGMETGHKFIVREDTNEVISCVTDKYQLLTNEELMKTAEPSMKKIGAILSEANVYSNNKRTVWKWRLPNTKVEIAKNDFVNPEIIIKNSYDGSSEVTAFAGAYRLVCTNGMIIGHTLSKESFRHIIWTDKTKIDNVIKSVISKTKTVFDDEFPTLVKTDINRNDIVKLIELFPMQTMDSMVKYLLKDNPKTYWDLLNAATWITSHIMDRDREATHKIDLKIYPMIKKLASKEAIAKA